MSTPTRIVKRLTANDVGDTGTHQAGILVPKRPEVLSFFPSLEAAEKNPRVRLMFHDDDGITKWQFVFIYYNNRFFGGTRNEYRLTCMTKYLRSKNAKVNDEVVLSRDVDNRLTVQCVRKGRKMVESGDVLVLSGGWKVISTR